MEYKIPYGKGEQVVSLPEEHVSQVLLPPVIDKPQTVAKLMEEALAHPIGTPTLSACPSHWYADAGATGETGRKSCVARQ